MNPEPRTLTGGTRPVITIQYPREPQIVAHGRTFVLGKVAPPDCRLVLDGEPVQVHRRGGFLAVVPVSRGGNSFGFKASRGDEAASLGVVLDVRSLRQCNPSEPPRIDVSSVAPQQSCVVGRGEDVWVSFSGTPGCRAACGYVGRDDRAELRELPRPGGVAGYTGAEEALGLYLGKAPKPPATGGTLLVELTSPIGGVAMERGAEVRLLKQDRWVVARQLTPLRVTPWGPPDWWLPESCPVKVRGTMGSCLLVERERLPLGWVGDLEPYDGDRPGSARLSRPTVRNLDDGLLLRISTTERLPYRAFMSEERDRLEVAVAGGAAPDTKGGLSWTEGAGAAVLSVDLSAQTSWGYRCRWTDKGLAVLVRRPPRYAELAGAQVCIDPGHGPQPGAIGPTGVREQSVNLALAVELERCLIRRGAQVVLTRRGPRGPSLADRVAVAEAARADFLLSLHHNAVPDGVDPYQNMGTSVYYFHEHCRALALRLQKALVAELGLGDLGALWGDLALCRGAFVPSALLEPAFMISPDHEALVITRDYRERCSEAIADGIEAYLGQALSQ